MSARPWGFLAIVALLIAGYAAAPSSQESGSGQAVRVIDGDTLEFDGQIIRLYGIDAPELGQLCDENGKPWPCGVEAALALRKLVSVSGQELRCSPWQGGKPERTADGAVVEVCQIGEQDLAQVMLQNGYGVATPHGFPDYNQAEKDAKDASLGIWHSHFLLPSVWRASQDDPTQPKSAIRDCNVKGAINEGGERIYYVPTDPEYKRVAIDPKRGERLFCSDEAARLAGWTRPPMAPVKSG